MILNLCSLVSGHNKLRSMPLGFTELMLSNRPGLVHKVWGSALWRRWLSCPWCWEGSPLVHQETCLEMSFFFLSPPQGSVWQAVCIQIKKTHYLWILRFMAILVCLDFLNKCTPLVSLTIRNSWEGVCCFVFSCIFLCNFNNLSFLVEMEGLLKYGLVWMNEFKFRIY